MRPNHPLRYPLLGLFLAINLLSTTTIAVAQSLKDLIKKVPVELLPFGNNEETIELLFSIPLETSAKEYNLSQHKEINDREENSATLPVEIYNEDSFKVVERTRYAIHMVWSDSTALQCRLLSAKKGNILAIIRSTDYPTTISTLQLFDAEGKDITSEYPLPKWNARLLLSEKMPSRALLLSSLLPVKLYFQSGKKPILEIALESLNTLTQQGQEELSDSLTCKRKSFIWKKEAFKSL